MYKNMLIGKVSETYAQAEALEWLKRRAEREGWTEDHSTSYMYEVHQPFAPVARHYKDGKGNVHSFTIYCNGEMDTSAYKAREEAYCFAEEEDDDFLDEDWT